MKKVEAFEASNGQLFPTEEECRAHEIALQWNSKIVDFICSPLCPHKGPAHTTIAKKIILAWEEFKAHEELLNPFE